MHSFILNNKKITVDEDINLLEFLREQEDLTSVKNGCSEGSCGACMVLVDKKAMRACKLSKECIFICVCKGRSGAVRILYARNDYKRQGINR